MADDGTNVQVKTEAESSDSSPAHKDDASQKLRRNTVSRPPSSHITRVDEEPPGESSRKGNLTRTNVETVDRGVGPTPIPPPVPPDHRIPYFGLPHGILDPRNGLIESPYGLPYSLPQVPYHSINAPLPLNRQTLEGHYNWPPTSSSFHHPLPGLPPSPAQSDVSLMSMRSGFGSGEPVMQLASRIQLEHLQRNIYYGNSLPNRRFSPGNLTGLSQSGSGLISDYPPPPSRSLLSDCIPPTPGSGSITLPGSLEGSRYASPRPSIGGGAKNSRKRALSHSPISDYLDIQSLTRSSEGSLQLTPFPTHNSRSSSAASGSYGHLSAASFGAVSPAHQPMSHNPYPGIRPYGTVPSSPFFYPQMINPLMGRHVPHHLGSGLPPTSQPLATPSKYEGHPHISTTTGKDASSSVVSSTMDSQIEAKKSKIKKEVDSSHHDHYDEDEDRANGDGQGKGGHIPQEGEPDFIETNCHWVDCSQEYSSQEELVKHINQDHIQANKKSFVCRWTDCSREEKPFKAQYMLVVHMRRHTGEKPHRCTFEGCSKAYSRLENLKTHLRSHTGEKPYMCEFPGCSKAFSNASDRAKHQNRTHSNAKPYVCKAAGCTKRYTDPSSLRKHVKTVHGPEFYANKKHKTNETHFKKEDDPDKDQDDAEGKKVEECLNVSSLQTTSGERRKSQDNVGSTVSQSNPSPQSSPEVNVTNSNQPELIEDNMNSGTGYLGGVEEEVDIPEPEEAEIPGSESLLVRRNRINSSHLLTSRLKGRMNNVQSTLPQIPTIHSPGGGRNSANTQPSLTDISNKVSQMKGSPQHKRITDLTGREMPNNNLLCTNNRRDSNTSTISSYLSSMRSDTSPYPGGYGSQFSSRRSSEASQISNRLSITNSPYEYDMTGNLPYQSRRSSESSGVGNVADKLQKATLGSQTNLYIQNQQMNMRNTSNKYANERLARFFATRKNEREMDGVRTSMSSRTPLPHEMPNREVRRASDPVRTLDPNFSALKRLQRFHSLNMMKPLPVPPGMKSLHKHGSNNTFHSSRSSIATDYSLAEDQEYGSSPGVLMENDHEATLEEKMMEDNEDMIIPDDMRRFLNEHCMGGDNNMQEYDPNQMSNMNMSDHSGSAQQSPYPNMSPVMQGNFHNMQVQGYMDNHSNMMNMSMNGGDQFNGPNNGGMMQGMQQGWNSGYTGGQNMQMRNMMAQGQTMQHQNPNMMRNMNPNPNMMVQHQNMTQQNMNMQGMGKQTANQLNHWNQGIPNQNQNMMPPPQQPMYAPTPPMMNKMMMQNQNPIMQQQMRNHYMQNGQQKQERESPKVQVPHISQSQIPPNAKTANRQQLLRQQMMQTMYENMPYPPQMGGNAMQQQQQNFSPNDMQSNMTSPQQIPNMQFIPHPPMYPQNSNPSPNCHVPNPTAHNAVDRSPGSNQVTSSTDRKETTAPPIEDFMENLTSISAENILENISSISTENLSANMFSPTALGSRSASQSSSRVNTVLNTSNMVVNDMSSMLTQLAEENKYLNMRN